MKNMTEINNEWIKKALAKRYGRNWKENMDRELIIRKISDQGTSESDIRNRGCIFFMLAGSPPKGYAIYQPSHRIIIIIDAWGNKKQTYQDKDYIED